MNLRVEPGRAIVRRTLLAGVSALLVPLPALAQTATKEKVAAALPKLKEFARQVVDKQLVPGLSIAIVYRDRETHARRPSQGQGDRVIRCSRADGVRRVPAARVWPVGDGRSAVMFRREHARYVATIGANEAAAIRASVEGTFQLLSYGIPEDPAIQRLFPRVYPDRPSDSAEFARLTSAELRSGKLEAARAVLDTLPADGGELSLDEQQVDAWLRALTDVRLVLGDRLEVTDDTDVEAELDDAVLRDPVSMKVAQLSAYAYLGYLQESLVLAVSDAHLGDL